MPDIKTIGVIAKPNTEARPSWCPRSLSWLTARGLELRLDEVTAAYAGRTSWLSRDELPDGCDFIIVLGGDGTLLAAARAVGGREVPLFAVNLGGLGFLTTITAGDLHTKLEGALRGEFRIGRRRMLHCDLVRGGEAVSDYEALNDVVLSKASIARMIDLETHADQQFVCRYKADGLVVSTPTGSTAYSLAAGGPIIFPSVDCLCITPICPHMLTNRPVIVPDSSVIRIRVCGGDDETFLTIDGQVGRASQAGRRRVCRSSAHSIRLVRPPKLQVLRRASREIEAGASGETPLAHGLDLRGHGRRHCAGPGGAGLLAPPGAHQQHLPALDPLYHCAPAVRDPGVWHRRHGQREGHGQDRPQGHRLFRDRDHDCAVPGPGRRQPGAPRRRHDPGKDRRRNCPSGRSTERCILPGTRLPRQRHRRHGQGRSAATGGLLAAIWRRLRGRRRQGQAGGGIRAGAGRGHVQVHGLRAVAGAGRRLRRHRGDGGRPRCGRAGQPGQARIDHVCRTGRFPGAGSGSGHAGRGNTRARDSGGRRASRF